MPRLISITPAVLRLPSDMTPTHSIDARVLNPGDLFYVGDLFYLGVSLSYHRQVIRTRVVAVGVTEILHGFQNHPGYLEYTLYSFGAKVRVPLDL